MTLRPADPDSSYPYALIGTAIDYRLRYAFEMTPYQQLVAWNGALLLTTKRWEREDDIPFDWDSVPVGMALPLPQGASGNPFEVAVGPYPLELLQAFFNLLEVTVPSILFSRSGDVWMKTQSTCWNDSVWFSAFSSKCFAAMRIKGGHSSNQR